MTDEPFARLINALPQGAAVLDVGCGECGLYTRSSALRPDLAHHGCDITAPSSPPPQFQFSRADFRGEKLPYDDDRFDFVLCSHVIEHLADPLPLFSECVRVLRPGGSLLVEAPSDRSTRYSFGGALHWHLIFSFWDDPTHLGRPWTPQALYRLGDYFGLTQLAIGYDTSWPAKLALPIRLFAAWIDRKPDDAVTAWWRAVGWAVFATYRKPSDARGVGAMRYFSYKGLPIAAPMPGVDR